MPKVKLNVNRRHWIVVPIEGEDGNWGTINAEFRVPTKNDPSDIKVVDLLTKIDGLELCDDDGRTLTDTETLEAVKRDDQIMSLVINAYQLGKMLKQEKQATLLKQRAD